MISRTVRLIIATILCISSAAIADSLTVVGQVTINADTTFEHIRVTSTGVLIGDAAINVSGDMLIESGGIVTHTLRLLEGLRLTVNGTLEIQPDGFIDLNAKGLRGGNNGHQFGIDGEVFDENGMIVGANGGRHQGAGASYGGRGANGTGGGFNGIANLPYGLLEDANYLGSGGGGTDWASVFHKGGNGGGKLRVTAGTVINNGVIRANGGNGVSGGGPSSGAGSGGSIRLEVDALSGSGFITAYGGVGAQQSGRSGAGGGGRIAIFYNQSTSPLENIFVRGGSGGNRGSTGTIYLKNNAEISGSVIIDNSNLTSSFATPLKSALDTFQRLTVLNQAVLDITQTDITAFTLEQQLELKNSAHLLLGSGVSMTVLNNSGFDVDIQSGAALTFRPGASFNANSILLSGGILNSGIDLDFPDPTDFQLTASSTVNILDSTIFSISQFDTTSFLSGIFNLTDGSRLDVGTNEIFIGGGFTLSKDGSFGVADQLNNIVIDADGALTHSTRFLKGLILNIGGTLEIRSGGLIDLNAKGLRGGNNGHQFGIDGEVFDENGMIVGANGGRDQGAGASYGGRGANGTGGGINGISNSPYGLLEDAVYLGSGGGGTDRASIFHKGGNGGGRLSLSAETLINNGIIRANGGNGVSGGGPSSGGGSGGSLRMEVNTLSGTGFITAYGGTGAQQSGRSGAGGGGRIAIYYNQSTFPAENIFARGGSGGNSASTGTVYLKKNTEANGTVIIDNTNIASSLFTPLQTNITTFDLIKVAKQGRYRPSDNSTTIQLDLLEIEEGALFNADAFLSVETITLKNGIIELNTPFQTENFTAQENSVIRVNAAFSVKSIFNISSGSIIEK